MRGTRVMRADVAGADLPANVAAGIRVEAIMSGSPADRHGIMQGDVIVMVAGKRVASHDELVAAIRAGRPGDSLPVVFFRGRRGLQADVVLTTPPAGN